MSSWCASNLNLPSLLSLTVDCCIPYGDDDLVNWIKSLPRQLRHLNLSMHDSDRPLDADMYLPGLMFEPSPMDFPPCLLSLTITDGTLYMAFPAYFPTGLSRLILMVKRFVPELQPIDFLRLPSVMDDVLIIGARKPLDFDEKTIRQVFTTHNRRQIKKIQYG